MNHKDWKGPGWYYSWRVYDKQFLGGHLKEAPNHLAPSINYEKFGPPKPPKEVLPDGLYHAEISTGDDKTIQGILAVHDGIWDVSNIKGVMLGGKYTVKAIGRIPTEPIEKGES